MTNEFFYVTDPLIIEVFLYRNNYLDRLLISELKEGAQLVYAPEIRENSFFVKAEEVQDILQEKFKNELLDLLSTPRNNIINSANSVYFLNNIISNFRNVKYLKINVSNAEVYSRKTNGEIYFDYRIVHSKVDFSSILNEEDRLSAKKLFIDCGLYSTENFNSKPYFEILTEEFIAIMSAYGSRFDHNDKINQIINGIRALIGTKVELDNPMLLVIIDK